MTYAPTNIEVYNRAFTGMIAGILGSRPSLDGTAIEWTSTSITLYRYLIFLQE